MAEYTCKKCGWVAFGVSRKSAEDSITRFNTFFDDLNTKDQMDFYGGRRASIEDYERCIRCGGTFINFRPAKDDDCPIGCTLNPIIVEGIP